MVSTPITPASLPCEVSQILASNCQSCHGVTPANGAPMSMVTWNDLTAPARSDMSHKVFELVTMRIVDRARPMPPDPTKRLSDTAIATLQAWAAAGASPGIACAGAFGGAAGMAALNDGQAGRVATGASAGNSAAVAGTGASGSAAGAGAAGGNAGGAGRGGGAGNTALGDPLDADIEHCYELHAHGQPTPGDTTPYSVPGGETYTGFIFKAPWAQPVQGLRFRHLPDNAAVLHHWLLYSESAAMSDGEIDACQLAGPTGFLCGQASTRALITGWAPGRMDFRLPADVGLELPAPGALLALEMHHFNNSGSPAADHSGVEICVTSKFRMNTASVSWLGTQTIDVPAHTSGTATGTCTPLRAGMNATDPIHVLFSWPHEHKLGRHLKSVVNRTGGTSDVLYDGDFSFDFQVLHDTPLLLAPGDTVTTTCTYDNTTDGDVSFGQSTTQEMCYNFTYAWPAHALDNAGAELGGATNACLH
jgi:hypothetical protein